MDRKIKSSTIEFSKIEELEKLYKQSPKRGHVQVYKISDNIGEITKNDIYNGYCLGIVPGLPVVVNGSSRWLQTSTVKDVDWENEIFHTLNSVYKFKFAEKD